MHPDEFSSKFIRNNTSNLVVLPGSQSQSSESNMNETNNSNNTNLDNSNANNNDADANTYNAELLLNLKKNNDHQSKHHDNMLSVNYSPKSNNSLSPGLIINDVHNNDEDDEEESSLPNREEYSPPISSSPPHENFGSSAASTTSSSSIIQHSDDLEKVAEVSSPSSSIENSAPSIMRNSRSQQIKSSANQNDYCNMSRSPSSDQKMQQQQHQTTRNLSNSTPSTSLIRKRDGSVNSQTSSGGGTIRSAKLDGISFLLNGSVVKGVNRKEVIPQRKRRDFIPNELKDDHYWERRRKNNLAAKRSREKRRLNDIVLETKVLELTNANNVLKLKLDLVMRKFDLCDDEMDKLFEENKHLLVVQESLDLHELLGSNDDSNQHMRGDSYDMSNEQSPMSNHQNQSIQSMHNHNNNNNESDSSIISNPNKKGKIILVKY
jgi:hypothetical protein